MRLASTARVTAATLFAAGLGAFVFHLLRLPLAFILGALTGAAIVANLMGPMPAGRLLRRGSQLFVGASIGVVLSPDVLAELVRLFPVMLAIAIVSNLIGVAIALPVARLAGIDRVTAILACLPAGMAEMATLARDVDADEQSVAVIHTLRVIMVVMLIPFWVGLTGHAERPVPMAPPLGAADLLTITALVAAALILALLATRLRVINAFMIAPMLLCLAVVAVGYRVPAVPQPVLILAQIGIGASLGLRFRVERLRRIPYVALGGLASGIVLIAIAFVVLSRSVELATGLDHLSAVLATAPGGFGEMIASAGALGVLVAAVAGFQLTRSIFTNLLVAPFIRWAVQRRSAERQGPAE